MPPIEPLCERVQANCDIADARHALPTPAMREP